MALNDLTSLLADCRTAEVNLVASRDALLAAVKQLVLEADRKSTEAAKATEDAARATETARKQDEASRALQERLNASENEVRRLTGLLAEYADHPEVKAARTAKARSEADRLRRAAEELERSIQSETVAEASESGRTATAT